MISIAKARKPGYKTNTSRIYSDPIRYGTYTRHIRDIYGTYTGHIYGKMPRECLSDEEKGEQLL
jgi:hypothetical protein